MSCRSIKTNGKVSAAIVTIGIQAVAEGKGALKDAATRIRKENYLPVRTKFIEKDKLLEEWVYKSLDSRPWDLYNNVFLYNNLFIDYKFVYTTASVAYVGQGH